MFARCGKIAERAHDAHGLLRRQRAQLLVERLCGGAIVLATEAHRVLPDRFDDVEYGVAFLLAQHVAEQPAEIADVLEQRVVLVLARAAAVLHGGRGGGLSLRHGLELFRFSGARGCRVPFDLDLDLGRLAGGGRSRGFFGLAGFRCFGRLVLLDGHRGLRGLRGLGGLRGSVGQDVGRRGVGRASGGRGSVAAGGARRSGRRHDEFPRGSQGLLIDELRLRTATSKYNVNCVQQGLRNGLQDRLLMRDGGLQTATADPLRIEPRVSQRVRRTAQALPIARRRRGRREPRAASPRRDRTRGTHCRSVFAALHHPACRRAARGPSPPSIALAHGAPRCLGTQGHK
ncbi:hypothetical protein QFZ89_000998 [Paraburkholderia youngii]